MIGCYCLGGPGFCSRSVSEVRDIDRDQVSVTDCEIQQNILYIIGESVKRTNMLLCSFEPFRLNSYMYVQSVLPSHLLTGQSPRQATIQSNPKGQAGFQFFS